MNIVNKDEQFIKLCLKLSRETLLKLVIALQEENIELKQAKLKIVELESIIAKQEETISNYKRSSYFYTQCNKDVNPPF